MFFRPHKNPHALVARLLGVKNGDRVAHVGSPDPGRLAAIVTHAGEAGAVVVLVPDQLSADRARAAAVASNVPEVKVVSLTNLGGPSATFDLVIVDDTHDLIESVRPERRRSVLAEIFRALRPGGRVIVVSQQPRGGTIGALLAEVSRPLLLDLNQWLKAEGFESVRRRTAPGELALTEGVKPSSG